MAVHGRARSRESSATPRSATRARGYPSRVQITFLGQAGLFVESKGVSILCDPWFNPSFFGSWFPFPANDGIDPECIGPRRILCLARHHDHSTRATCAT